MTDKIQTDTTNLGSREQAILEKYDRESVTRQTNPLQKGSLRSLPCAIPYFISTLRFILYRLYYNVRFMLALGQF